MNRAFGKWIDVLLECINYVTIKYSMLCDLLSFQHSWISILLLAAGIWITDVFLHRTQERIGKNMSIIVEGVCIFTIILFVVRGGVFQISEKLIRLERGF